MSERTYLGVNIEVIGNNFNVMEKEIFNYSWGGASNYMFQDLITLFKNVKYYIFETKFTETKYHDYIFESLKRKIKNFNILKNNIINPIKNSENTKLSVDHDENINQWDLNTYYDTITCAEDGFILVDIKLKANESHCKWCFGVYDEGKLTIAKNYNEIKSILKFDKIQSNYFDKLMEMIDFISTINSANTDGFNHGNLGDVEYKTVDYDPVFFQSILSNY